LRLRRRFWQRIVLINQSFLVLFSKKELLPSYLPPHLCTAAQRPTQNLGCCGFILQCLTFAR
jgi:hypothetical protein